MHKRFRENEISIVSTLEGLHSITETTEMTQIHNLLSELSSQVEQMCWVFIDYHQVFRALKKVKNHFRTKGEDTSIVSRLQSKLEGQYNDNRQQYPSILPHPLCPASYLRNNNSWHCGSTTSLKYNSRPAHVRPRQVSGNTLSKLSTSENVSKKRAISAVELSEKSVKNDEEEPAHHVHNHHQANAKRSKQNNHVRVSTASPQSQRNQTKTSQETEKLSEQTVKSP